MRRVESARSDITDEIPLAKRTSPSIQARSGSVRFLALSLILLGALVIALPLGFFPRYRGATLFFGLLQLPTSEGRLLGHYPYLEASSDDLISVYPGLQIHKDTYKALKSMRSAATADGINLILLSGYRSIELQRQIFYGRKSSRSQIAIERAKVSAPPGYSEHSTGYAIDLGDGSMRATDLEVEFESTPAFKWLKKYAAKYHFVLSFPKGNPQKVSYEPWHWRFEGTVDALRQFEPSNEKRRVLEPMD